MFIGRIATVLVAVAGLAAGYALVCSRFGTGAALIAGSLWIASPYLFFYERLAFSDAQAERIASYPRPGETSNNASVVLWKLERP